MPQRQIIFGVKVAEPVPHAVFFFAGPTIYRPEPLACEPFHPRLKSARTQLAARIAISMDS